MKKKITKIKEPIIGYDIAAGKAIIFKKMIIDELNLYNDKRLKYGGEDVDMYLKIKESNYIVISIPFVYHAHANKTNSLFHFLKKEYYFGKIGGVISRIYGIKIGGGYGVLLKLGVYISLLIPKINLFSGVVLLIHYFRYTYKIYKTTKFQKEILLLPFYRLLKDIVVIYGYVLGYMEGKQWKYIKIGWIS